MFKDRLREARQNRGMTQVELAQKIRTVNSTVAGYESGRSEPDMKRLAAIITALDVDANWLLADEMDSSSSKRNIPSDESRLIAKRFDNLDEYGKHMLRIVSKAETDRCETMYCSSIPMKIRVYNSPFSLVLASESDYQEEEYFSKDVPVGTEYAIKLIDDAMSPSFPKGSIVFIQHTNTVAENDVVIALTKDKEIVCRRAVLDQKGNIFFLKSDNVQFQTLTGRRLENIQIIGKVLGVTKLQTAPKQNFEEAVKSLAHPTNSTPSEEAK